MNKLWRTLEGLKILAMYGADEIKWYVGDLHVGPVSARDMLTDDSNRLLALGWRRCERSPEFWILEDLS